MIAFNVNKWREDVLNNNQRQALPIMTYPGLEYTGEKTLALLNSTKSYRNFVISSGCDIPPDTEINNIQSFFDAIDEFNKLENAKNLRKN